MSPSSRARSESRGTVRPDAIAEAAARLQEAIESGHLQPNQRLVEAGLADQFGISRATVRMAMQRLEHLGFIVRERHRGARVRLVTEREAIEAIEVRAGIEIIVVRHAAENATARDIAGLREIMHDQEAAFATKNIERYGELSGAFHRRISEIAAHETAARILANVQPPTLIMQYRVFYQPGRFEDSIREHRAVFAAIAAKDPDAAQKAMWDHLHAAIASLRRSLTARRSTVSILD